MSDRLRPERRVTVSAGSSSGVRSGRALQAELILVIAGIHDELNTFQSNCAFLRNHVYFYHVTQDGQHS